MLFVAAKQPRQHEHQQQQPVQALGTHALQCTFAPSAALVRAARSDASWPQPSRPPSLQHQALQLRADGWKAALKQHRIDLRYPSLVGALQDGLSIGIVPPERTSIATHFNSALESPDVVSAIVPKELTSNRYTGPYSSAAEVEAILGPFQTAPLGLLPKPNGKFRLTQDFSFPRQTTNANQTPSFNSALNIEQCPTTWYTFDNICDTILQLLRTAQAFVRDVTSAFHQIHLHRKQRTVTVVECQRQFYIDQFLAFGLGPACGAIGLVGDAFADVCRASGLGPTEHWVDDNGFFRVLITHLPALNAHRASIRTSVLSEAVRQLGRLYWTDNSENTLAEIFSHTLRTLPHTEDRYNCGLGDIDAIFKDLGWP
ncbi:hypothetical protein CF336_g6641 [Tilletia laevis]|uniref:Reverse transcriptase domain-containing protein n=1 Tax=Tilletia caries TaxID=13290 RepID=A0A177TYZ4_9BASI|nr:hypothetical protein CF328_g7164 [Tilletia controversa]KAE8187253.1 hypothetical protein CF336_g6641 [Tilletia laevis]KAE8187422.1 hypothetical protein CF335_g7177 [Tilletia laevis]KAE8247407.1 hypothetical protein A4X03_0g7050 [Tilletia caries]